MLVTKMDLLNYQYMDKMNNNIGILCYEGEAALGVDPRMHQSMSMSLSSSGVTNHSHRTGPPPINPGKRKLSLSTGQGQQDDDEQDCDNQHMTKMNRLVTAQLGQPSNGDFRSTKDPRDRSRSPIERAAAPSMVLHGNHLYAPHHHMPSLAMVQPLALTKNNMDAARTVVMSPTVSPVARQQNRPSVITCARANTLPSNYIRRPASSSNTACVDPVIEEHFRRSLGRNYKQPEPITNSVSITGTVDDHFTKALGETWLQIKAKGSSSSSPDSSPNSHMVNHSHSPSVLS